MSRKRYKYTVSLYGKGHVIRSLWFELGSIHCELKMDKQGFQAGESR